MCGIAGIDRSAGRDAAAGARGRCVAHGRRAAPSRPRRVRHLPRPARRPRARAAVDHRSRDRPAAARPTRTGTIWVVFNGEIFNYVELRAELAALGHRFRTQSDTEVIVHAYEAWGDDAFARFNGQWAIALWDARDADAGARARPARRAAALPLRARRAALVRERGEGDLRRRSDRSRARSIRSASTRRSRSGRTVAPAVGVRRDHRARARPRPHHRTRRHDGHGVLGSRSYPRRRDGRILAARSTRRSSAVRDALERGDALRMLRADVPGRQLPVRRARQLARRGARTPREGRAGFRRSRCASRTRSTTRRASSG